MNGKSSKVVLLGDGSVGKTSIRKRYLGDGFSQQYTVTFGAEFSVKKIGNSVYQIYDLAGQDSFASVRQVYYAGSQGVILIFSINLQSSFKNMHKWAEEVLKYIGDDKPVLLVGNKADLRGLGEGQITEEQANELVIKLNAKFKSEVEYVETSAKSGHNIEELFNNLFRKVEAQGS